MKSLSRANWLGLALALAVFAAYWATLAPAVQPEDSGEIAASLYTLGVVHPSGYPLFTLLGGAFSRLPLGGTVIWRLNLFVALLCAVAVFLFYRLFLFLLAEHPAGASKPLPSAQGKTRKQKGIHPPPPAEPLRNELAAATAALLLAFSRTFWSEALSLEVYAFHLVFLAGVTLLFLRSLSLHARDPSGAAHRAWILFAFSLGLSFSNHMMTVLLAPAFLYLYFSSHGAGRAAWAKIGAAALPFLAGLSLYLYLPLRAAQKPLMNWGDPSSAGNFWRHVTTEQYRYKMFSSPDVAFRKLADFLSQFPPQFAYVGLALAAVGLWTLFRRNRRMLAFSALVFLGCVLYAVNYDFDDPNFYLNAYAATAVWMLYGLRATLEAARGRRGIAFAGVLCGALVLFSAGINYRAVDQSGDYAVEDYVKNTLEGLVPNAVLFTGQSRNLSLPADYYQWVEKIRPDVVLLDYKLMTGSFWYYELIERRHPDFFAGSRPEIEAYVRSARAFRESGEPDARPLLLQFMRMARGILARASQSRPVYATYDIQPEYMEGFHAVPSGLVIRLLPTAPANWDPASRLVYRPFTRTTSDIEEIRGYYANGLLNQGIYMALARRDTARGTGLIREALVFKPEFPPAADWLRNLGAR